MEDVAELLQLSDVETSGELRDWHRTRIAQLEEALQWAEMRLPEKYRATLNAKRNEDPAAWASRRDKRAGEAKLVQS